MRVIERERERERVGRERKKERKKDWGNAPRSCVFPGH